jgi:phage-related protein
MKDFEVIFYEKENGVDDGIFEIRCKVGSNIVRVLYFFFYGGKIVLTNGFMKKTNKTPMEELRLAKEYRADFKERMSGV